MNYDWQKDAIGCWRDAIAFLRLWGLITGKYAPIAGERDWRWT